MKHKVFIPRHSSNVNHTFLSVLWFSLTQSHLRFCRTVPGEFLEAINKLRHKDFQDFLIPIPVMGCDEISKLEMIELIQRF